MNQSWVFPPPAPAALSIAGREQQFPVHRIYCVGRNYAAHAREMGADPEREAPFFFSKPADAVTQAPQVAYPSQTADLQHEVELVVALASGGTNIASSQARNHVFGYAVGVDLTRRDLQAQAKAKRRSWDVAKGFDQSAPISMLIPATDSGHLQQGAITLKVNQQARQTGDLADMIWPVSDVIAELSRYFSLQPGDLIFTGTPEGVAALQRGDEVEAEIQGLTRHRFVLI